MSPTALPAVNFNDEVASFVKKLSPTLHAHALDYDASITNTAVDAELDAFDADAIAAQKIQDAELLNRILADLDAAKKAFEDGFAAVGVPFIDGAAPPFEAWAIPVIASFCTPAFAPFVSAGLLVSLKALNLALDKWKAAHDAAQH